MQSSPSAKTGRLRRPLALVVREPDPEEIGARVDWSAWYLTDEEDMGEGCEQGEIIRILLSCLGQLAAERGWQNVLIAGDNFFAWVKDEPLVRVSPDVYLLDEPPPPPLPKMWETWQPGHRPPRFAVEIVSDDWKKDYEDNPPKYAQLGCRELVIFDPEAALKPDRKGTRVPLQVYRRDEDGAFVKVYRGDGPVYCEQIGAHLATRREGATVRLRVARDGAGTSLVPTAEEEVERLKAEIEALRRR
ncbi:Uma2 family endonuclease [Polyangium aurulentum]|uniref:Uma2 family endonuclease n=1 Tax=Polyangium aurulentum TaxID=2567896 RepID=UPI00146F3205|nr:Uma2 family endonuclease [Polyangium aurulentum]UQA61134.1 Uma2 family endonuclease [Polyangium aurulentum]